MEQIGQNWEALLKKVVQITYLNKEEITAVMLMIQGEEEVAEMLRWLDQNREPSTDEILEEAIQLSPDMDED